MNMVYAGIALLDIVKIAIIFCFIFGFELKKNKLSFTLATLFILASTTMILLLEDPSNRIFIALFSQVILAVVCINGKKKVVIQLSILIHFLLCTSIDLIQSVWILCYYSGETFEKNDEVWVNGIGNTLELVIIIMFAIALSRKRKAIGDFLQSFTFSYFVYYFIVIVISGIVIGFTDYMAFDTEVVYRLRVASVIAANCLGIFIVALAILAHVFMIQKRSLAEYNNLIAKCLERQVNQFKIIGNKNEHLQKFRHDYKGHLSVIRKLTETKELERLLAYLDGLNEVKKSQDYFAVNNVIADGIINEYAEKSKEGGISFHVVGRFPDCLTISDIDLCSLLVNGIENAYEAAVQCSDKKQIIIEIKNYLEHLYLCIGNTTVMESGIENGQLMTTKDDKSNHGFGTKNMIDVVEKYGGDITWTFVNDGYILTKIEV